MDEGMSKFDKKFNKVEAHLVDVHYEVMEISVALGERLNYGKPNGRDISRSVKTLVKTLGTALAAAKFLDASELIEEDKQAEADYEDDPEAYMPIGRSERGSRQNRKGDGT